jgi:hypothetical protein
MVGVDQAGREMSRRRSALAAGLALCGGVAAAVTIVRAQQPTFRARTDLVSVPVSVMKGRDPVMGLTPADFEITDNGVRQTVDSVASDRIPIDVTLVLTARPCDRDVEQEGGLVSAEATRKLLSPADRLRMVWIRRDVAGRVVGDDYRVATDPAARALGGGRAIPRGCRFGPNDGMANQAGVSRSPTACSTHWRGRWTPTAGILPWCSRTGGTPPAPSTCTRLRTLASHSDAVLHAVFWAAPGEDTGSGGGLNLIGGIRRTETARWQESYDILGDVVRRSGGTLQRSAKAADALADIIADFRSSYILRYSPRGVAASGWHELGVRVSRPGSFKIRARKGYEGG